MNPSYKFEPVPGHGLESRQYGGASEDYLQSITDQIVAPTEHYPHPYKEEIESLEYRSYQLEVEGGDSGEHGSSGTLKSPALSAMKGIWIDTERDLIQLVDRINLDDMREIAIDLEAHSFRSFSGFVCLMQLSLRRPKVDGDTVAQPSDGGDSIQTGYDFVIDTLALRRVMNEHFAPIMANPDIVKVMHGADSDVGWLQRDFGIYIVNLFDTGRASRALHFSSAGLAYLLSKYANVEADKKHQLSDWRQRPLPADMLSYAQSDTMYLLDIYDELRLELSKHDEKKNGISITAVLDESKKVCLIRYDKEPFKPNAYRKLVMSKRGKKMGTNLNDQQDALLKALYDWRDNTAREEDESAQHVCGNTGLVRIASNCPQTVLALNSCMNPLPPLVLKYANDILRLVRMNTGAEGSAQESIKFSAEKKVDAQLMSPDASSKSSSSRNADRSGMMSPVLDTEDLYRRAGWTTPQSNLITADDDVTSSSDAEVHEISTHAANRDFSTSKFTQHSLEMKLSGAAPSGRSKGVDGMGAAKAAMNEGEGGSEVEMGAVEKQRISAQKVAGRIRDTMMSANQNLLGLVKPTTFINEGCEVDNQRSSDKDGDKSDEDNDDSDDEFRIPKSMKEIYQ